MGLGNLSLHCANLELKNSLKTNELKKKVANQKEGASSSRNHFMKLYNTLKFDLYHRGSELEGKEPFLKKLKS